MKPTINYNLSAVILSAAKVEISRIEIVNNKNLSNVEWEELQSTLPNTRRLALEALVSERPLKMEFNVIMLEETMQMFWEIQ